jgi:hypothetical protein
MSFSAEPRLLSIIQRRREEEFARTVLVNVARSLRRTDGHNDVSARLRSLFNASLKMVLTLLPTSAGTYQ